MPENNGTNKHRNVEFSANYFHWSFDDSSDSGLWPYFGRVLKGQPEIYDTPFAKGESTEHMLSEWKEHLESLSTRWPSLYEYEIDLSKKVGPMSVMKPLKDRMSDIDSYYDGILLPSKPIGNMALRATINEYSQVRGLRLRGQKRTVDLMKLSTNSGSPYFTKRRNVVDMTLPCHVTWYREMVQQDLNGDPWNACAVLGWRGQEGGPTAADVKQRVVWMFPFAVNVCELQVYQPLIEAFQHFNLVPAWVSMESVDREITDLFDSKGNDDLVVCTDFSKFDQHFNPSLQEAAKIVLINLLTDDASSRQWLRDVYPVKYMIPLTYAPGQVRFGKHGMGSGSGGTNCDETLAHRALQYAVAYRNAMKLKPSFTVSWR
jgi:hypothetical protein